MLALLEKAQRGEPTAYDRLYNLYADKIFRYLYARLNQRENAEDLTADVFVRLVQTLPRFRVNSARPVASFSAWLYRIAGNLLTDEYRKQRHRHHQDIDQRLDLADRAPGPLQQSASSEESRRLMMALSELGSEQQSVLLYRFAEGFSLTEVAELMGKTVGAVKALQHRAIANLRLILTRKGGAMNPEVPQVVRNLDDAFAACLDDLAAGLSLAETLARYPDYAEALAPLLETSARLSTVAWPRLSGGGRVRGRERMHAELEKGRRRAGAAWWRPAWSQLAVASLLLVLAASVWLAWPGRELRTITRPTATATIEALPGAVTPTATPSVAPTAQPDLTATRMPVTPETDVTVGAPTSTADEGPGDDLRQLPRRHGPGRRPGAPAVD